MKESREFFNRFKSDFENDHADDIRALASISLPEHVQDNELAKIYRGNRYRVTIGQVAFHNLILFLESLDKDPNGGTNGGLNGGGVLIFIIHTYLQVVTVDRSADERSGLAALLYRAKAAEDLPAEDEGIPGHNPGSANVDQSTTSTTLPRLKLGRLPMDAELMGDVRAELEDEDTKNPPAEGQSSLLQHFEQQIKREESEEAPTRAELQYGPSVARDVQMEVQKVKEDRDRFRIDGRTGGVGPGVSVTMFTFHNTHDRSVLVGSLYARLR